MALETFIPKVSLTIVTLLAVYLYDWIFLILDDLFSPIVRDLLEYGIKSLFKPNFKFQKFFYYIPNFVVFILSLIVILPFFINVGIGTLNPILENYLNESPLSFGIAVVVTFGILYFLFMQFYYKLKKKI